MFRRRLGVYVVFVALVVLALAAASHAYAAEMSVGEWWDTTYGGTYGTFENVWTWESADFLSVTRPDELFKLQVELAGFANTNTFGWFDIATDPLNYNGAGNGYHEIFSGPDGAGVTKTVVLPQGPLLDFYLHTEENKTWHGFQPFDSVPDGYMDHMWLFSTTNADWLASQPDGYESGFLMAWEDQSHEFAIDPTAKHWVLENGLWVYDASQAGVAKWYAGGGSANEPDNQDMIVTLWGEGQGRQDVPEPGSLGLVAMALCGAIAAGRKRFAR